MVKVKLQVKKQQMLVDAAGGDQTCAWLAITACARYGLDQGLSSTEYYPAFVKSDEGKIINPQDFVKDLDIKEDSVLQVVTEDEVPPDEPHLHGVFIRGPAFAIPPFVANLYSMLSDPEAEPFLAWNKGGDTLVLQRKEEFAVGILVKHMHHSNLDYFFEQLRRHGFVRKVEQEGSDVIRYVHPLFRAGKRFLMDHYAEKWKMKVAERLANRPPPKKPLQLFDKDLNELRKLLDQKFEEFINSLKIEALTGVNASKMTEMEKHKLKQIFLDNMTKLKYTFRWVSIKGVGNANPNMINNQQFWRMCVDFGISDLDGRQTGDELNQAETDQIFIQANVRSMKLGAVGSASNSKKDTARLLIFPEFLGALIRLAVKKYPDMQSQWVEAFERLLEKHVLPFTPANVEQVYNLIRETKEALMAPGARAVLNKWRPKMEKVYETYARLGEDLGSMQYGELVDFAKRSSMIDEGFTSQDLKTIFTEVQLLDTQDGAADVDHDEFFEILARIFMTKSNRSGDDLDKPFESRLDKFLAKTFNPDLLAECRLMVGRR